MILRILAKIKHSLKRYSGFSSGFLGNSSGSFRVFPLRDFLPKGRSMEDS